MSDEIRERLAEYAHKAWSGWMKYLFKKSIEVGDGCVEIPNWAVERWTRQSNTTYKNLPEDEKESDREEADQMIEIAGHKSCDEEVRDLQAFKKAHYPLLESANIAQKQLEAHIRKLEAENKKLRDALEYIKRNTGFAWILKAIQQALKVDDKVVSNG